jgi:DnaK suppressor protein
MNDARARQIVGAERARLESMLAGASENALADRRVQNQQTGEYAEAGATVESESVSLTLAANLRSQLADVVRAEQRIEAGTYGRSVESGSPIPDERLEAEPLAERTVEEQRTFEHDHAR